MSEDRRPQGTVQIALRIAPDLRERVKAAAEANNRSVNSELTATLEDKYPPPRVAYDHERVDQIIFEMRTMVAIAKDPSSTADERAKAIEKFEALSREYDEIRTLPIAPEPTDD